MDDFTITSEELKEYLNDIIEKNNKIIEYINRTPDSIIENVDNFEIFYRLDVIRGVSNDILNLYHNDDEEE